MKACVGKQNLSDSIIPFIIAFLQVTILFAGFGYLYSLILYEYPDSFFIIQYDIVVLTLFLIFLLSFTKFRKGVANAIAHLFYSQRNWSHYYDYGCA